ncbi:MAG: M13 family metallopeptidase [Acidobacteriaceae bacterium]
MRSSRILTAFLLLSLPVPVFAQSGETAGHGVVLANIDPAVKPGDNFYLYANGAWMQRTAIPADRAVVSGFSTVADRTDQQVAGIIENAEKADAAPDTNQRLIADLYRSYMDTAAIDAAGLKPLQTRLDAIAAIHTRTGLARVLGQTLRADTDALNNTHFHTSNLFGLWVAPSFNDPNHYTAYLMQGGVILPDRSFYLSDNQHMKDIRAKYQTHVAAMFRFAGLDDVDARAARVIALETAIAQVQESLADSENIQKANNPWNAADFAAKAPGLDWKTFFAAAGLEHQPSFIVWQPQAFTGESALVASQPIATWQDYLRFHLIEHFSADLPTKFADEYFDFFGKTLQGSQAQRPRNQLAIQVVNAVLGDAVGRLYAEQYFSAAEKAKVQQLVANLIATFHQTLEKNTWLAPSTKAEALRKLGALQVGIGYPDSWRSYAGLEIRPDDLVGNLWRAGLFQYRYELRRIGKPVDRREWCMEPQTVNAVNLPLDNGLNFPAAILQPPFYDPQAPDAFNYGAIGSVIGHEISHTFDSEGAAFDSQGRVRNWWTPADLAHFRDVTARLAAQYDAYRPFPDVHVNGRQTLGEDIADVAGLIDSYDAYHASLHGRPAPLTQGLTGDQEFFLAFGQNWQQKAREAIRRQQVVIDPHAPAQFRADTVRNVDGWYKTFDVQPGQTLYLAPLERIHIW